MFESNLPPGCTDKDIENNAGGYDICPDCDGIGSVDGIICETCEGKGKLE